MDPILATVVIASAVAVVGACWLLYDFLRFVAGSVWKVLIIAFPVTVIVTIALAYPDRAETIGTVLADARRRLTEQTLAWAAGLR